MKYEINFISVQYISYGKKISDGSNWRASEASETLSGVHKFELVRYINMYGGT